MKTALILILFVALLAAAFFARPTQADFKQYITNQKTNGDTHIVKAGLGQLEADWVVSNCTFNDRFLWVDVQQNGKTVYTGAFGHWFNRAQMASDMKGVEQKIDNVKLDAK